MGACRWRQSKLGVAVLGCCIGWSPPHLDAECWLWTCGGDLVTFIIIVIITVFVVMVFVVLFCLLLFLNYLLAGRWRRLAKVGILCPQNRFESYSIWDQPGRARDTRGTHCCCFSSLPAAGVGPHQRQVWMPTHWEEIKSGLRSYGALSERMGRGTSFSPGSGMRHLILTGIWYEAPHSHRDLDTWSEKWEQARSREWMAFFVLWVSNILIINKSYQSD